MGKKIWEFGLLKIYRKMMIAQLEGAGQPGIPRPEPALGANLNRVGGARILARRHELQNVKQLCLWPRDYISIRTFWGRLRLLLPDAMFSRIRKVIRVRQPRDHRRRFDIFVDRDYWLDILQRLHDARHLHSWWVRPHAYYLDRRGDPEDAYPAEAQLHNIAHVQYVKFATWNICSLGGKRDEVGYYLTKSQVSVLALQETLRTMDKYSFCLRGYQIFESLADKDRLEGKRGLAFCIRSCFPAYELGHQSPFLVAVQSLIGLDKLCLINIYIPPKGNRFRREATKDVKSCLSKLFAANPDAKVIVMGDWNNTLEKLPLMLAKWRLPLQLLPCRGNPATFKSRANWTAIDHIVVSSGIFHFVKAAKVNRGWDQSDHWPLECVLRSAQLMDAPNLQVNNGPRLDIPKLREKQDFITSHNLWDELIDFGDEENLPEVANRFEETVWKIAEEADCLKEVRQDNILSPAYRLSKLAKAAIARRLRE